MAEILIAGFGGQGIMRLGKILAQAALRENKYTTFFPSYGAEMRGGTAHCFVNISEEAVASPLIEHADTAIILNQPSLNKFEKKIKKGGLLIINSDLIHRGTCRKDIKEIASPLNRIALECGNIKAANIIALGILLSSKPNLLNKETVIEVLRATFSKKEILKQNLEAFHRGATLIATDRETRINANLKKLNRCA